MTSVNRGIQIITWFISFILKRSLSFIHETNKKIKGNFVDFASVDNK